MSHLLAYTHPVLAQSDLGLFFLSIPIPGFIPSDRFAWTGPLRLSFTDRRNSSLRSSDTTGRAFGKPNRTLVPAPMVFRHKTLHLTAELTAKENTTKNLQQQEAGLSGLFPVRIIFLKSRLVCNSVITLVGGDRDWRPLELWRVSFCFF